MREGSWVETAGHGLCSSASPDVLIDDAASNVETTNVKRLLRLHYGDVIQLKEGSSLVLYFNPQSAYVLKHVSTAQMRLRAKVRGSADLQHQGGATISLSGRKFICLQGYVKTARSHHDAIHGMLLLPQLKKKFYDMGATATVGQGSSSSITVNMGPFIEDPAGSISFSGEEAQETKQPAEVNER